MHFCAFSLFVIAVFWVGSILGQPVEHLYGGFFGWERDQRSGPYGGTTVGGVGGSFLIIFDHFGSFLFF